MRLLPALRFNHRPAPPRSSAWAAGTAIASVWLLLGGCAVPWAAGEKKLETLTATPYPSAVSAEKGPFAARPTASRERPIGTSARTPPEADPAGPSAADKAAAGGAEPQPSAAVALDQVRQPAQPAIAITPSNLQGRVATAAKSPAAAKAALPPEQPAVANAVQAALSGKAASGEAQLIQQLLTAVQAQQAAQQAARSASSSAPAARGAVPPAAEVTGTTSSAAAATEHPAESPTATAAVRRSWRELCEQASAALEAELRERKDGGGGELAALQQKLRLLYVATERTDLAATAIDELTPAERQAYREVAFALATWLSPEESRHLNLRGAKVLRSLREANDKLAAVSKLDLKNLAFCEKVEGYGWYTQFSRAEFTPRQEVLLYLEVENFAAAENGSRQFETELQGSYQIFNAAGAIVDQRQLPLDRETCRNLRRDYFIAYRIYLPEQLPPGRYRLELTVEDLKAKDYPGRKLGEGMIEFTIRS